MVTLLKRIQNFLSIWIEINTILWYSFLVYCKYFWSLAFPPEPKSIRNEVILITGSAQGIGREICLKLATSGATLICWDIETDLNDELIIDLKSLGVKAFAYTVDISERAQVIEGAAKIRNELGLDVSIIINNAGIMPCHKFLNYNPKEIVRVFNVNVLSHIWILREFLPDLIARNHGHIVTISSAAGLIPTRNLVPYCSTKFAVNGLIDGLKEELRTCYPPNSTNNIHFTTVYPFSTRTNLIKNIRCNSRFPDILPISEPEAVAAKVVDGMLRNIENVYVPNTIQAFGILARTVLTPVQAAGTDFFQSHVQPETEDVFLQ